MSDEHKKSARVYEALHNPLRFTVECNAEVVEETEGDETHLKVYLHLLCNGRAHSKDQEFFLVDEKKVDENGRFTRLCLVGDMFRVMQDRFPDWLLERAQQGIFEAINIAVRDDDYIPPRSPTDWSYKKLYNAVDKALHTFLGRRNPTLATAAKVISQRYGIRPALTPDALRMLLKRHGVPWKTIKGELIAREKKAAEERKRTRKK